MPDCSVGLLHKGGDIYRDISLAINMEFFLAYHCIYVVYRQPDTEKVASMQALLADNFGKNCGHFCINNVFLQFVPINCHMSLLLIHN